MKKLRMVSAILLTLTTLPLLSFLDVRQDGAWVDLFDGKTLKGWHTIPGGTWTVENGQIVGKSPASDQRHGLLVSDKVYGDFVLEVTYKAIRGNSGVYFRSEEVGGVVGVKGFQAEIDPQKDAGGLYETNGRAWVVKPTAEQVQSYYKPNAWNTMRITAKGRDITVTVNGKVSAALKDDPGLTEGHIALQLHGSQEMLVLFKSVRIREY